MPSTRRTKIIIPSQIFHKKTSRVTEKGNYSGEFLLVLKEPVDADREKLCDSGKHGNIGIRTVLFPFRNRLYADFKPMRQRALSQSCICAKLSYIFANTKCQVRYLRFLMERRTVFYVARTGLLLHNPDLLLLAKGNGN